MWSFNQNHKMKKTFLLSYKSTMFQALNSGFTFDLMVEVHYLFGLIKVKKMIVYECNDFVPLSSYTLHWDKLIINKLPLK